MSNGDYIKLHRSMLKWEWYKNTNTKVLFLHMLLRANWKEGRFEGRVIPKGSFASSLASLADESGLSVREVRTAISHLKMSGELTVERHAKFSVFTIENYLSYQSNDKGPTSERQTTDKRATTIEEKKEEKKERNNKYTCAFEEFWQAYPRKKDKGNAFKKFNTRLNSGFSDVELIGAAKKYAAECASNQTEEKYIKHPATFLSDSLPFLEYIEKEKPKVEEIVLEEDESIIDLWSEE